jgi:type III secretion system FlhB-like substrate exporter
MNTTYTPKKVVGLRYEDGQRLPQVVLKGAGPLADEILRRRGPGRRPPVVRNDALLEQLYRLPIDAEIGPELYRVVAFLLVHVFAVEALMKGEHN